MRNTTAIVAVLLVLVFGAGSSAAEEPLRVTGEQQYGVRSIDLSDDSARFNQYRDLRNGFYLDGLLLDILDTRRGLYLDLDGRNLLRDDQAITARIGSYADRWRLTVDNTHSPQRFGNRAMTPYFNRGGGLLTLPGKVPILNDGNDATGTPSLVPTAAQMAVNDMLIAGYLATGLHAVRLDARRERTGARADLSHVGPVDLSFAYSDERRAGSRLGYGTIGDRPPRTLHTQIAEPLDYQAREILAEASYSARGVQTQLRYSLSLFENRLESMRFENMFFTPNAGADYATTVPGTARNVADVAQRSLAPDNQAHQVTLTAGVDLPARSRLTSTVAAGYMRQNETLLPYSYSTLGGDLHAERGDGLDWNDPAKLPRRNADAQMNTLRFDLEYAITPIDRLDLRPFFRYHKLDNRTPTADWRYVTQDVAGTDGDVNYRNYRRNLAYAFERQSYGIDARRYLGTWRTTLGLGYSHSEVERDFREANTDEDVLNASLRSRPTSWLSLNARYLHGNRTGDGYDYHVTSQTYWYPFALAANEVDNPQYLFADHPDLRRSDVSDRLRDQFSVGATVAARQDLDLTAAYRYRKDDFDSAVGAVAPLAGTDVPLPNPDDENALTPGRQLGILEDLRHNITVDVNYTAGDRWTFTVFADREEGRTDARGMVYNENQRREPSNSGIQSPTSLGPWTDPDRLYETESKQVTNTLGVVVGFTVIQDKLRLLADYSMSRTKVDLGYSGYGSDADYLGRDWETFQFGFNDPESVRYHWYELNASAEYTVARNLTFGLHYLFNWYRIQDWMQEPDGPWVEEVGSEYYLRDTSQDNRWGNRLVTMGGYQAPNYEAHMGYLTMTMKF